MQILLLDSSCTQIILVYFFIFCFACFSVIDFNKLAKFGKKLCRRNAFELDIKSWSKVKQPKRKLRAKHLKVLFKTLAKQTKQTIWYPLAKQWGCWGIWAVCCGVAKCCQITRVPLRVLPYKCCHRSDNQAHTHTHTQVCVSEGMSRRTTSDRDTRPPAAPQWPDQKNCSPADDWARRLSTVNGRLWTVNTATNTNRSDWTLSTLFTFQLAILVLQPFQLWNFNKVLDVAERKCRRCW